MHGNILIGAGILLYSALGPGESWGDFCGRSILFKSPLYSPARLSRRRRFVTWLQICSAASAAALCRAHGRTARAACGVQVLEPRQLLSVGIAIDDDPDPGPGPNPGAPPVIASLVASPQPVNLGVPLTLTANGVTGRAVAVSFYVESNGQPGLQGPDDPGLPQDNVVGRDATSSGGYTVTLSTAGLAAGTYTYYAQAEGTVGVFPEVDRATSNIVSTTSTLVQPNAPPTIAGLQAASDTLLPPNTMHLTPLGVSDPNGAADIAQVQYWYDLPGYGRTIWASSAGIARPTARSISVRTCRRSSWCRGV